MGWSAGAGSGRVARMGADPVASLRDGCRVSGDGGRGDEDEGLVVNTDEIMGIGLELGGFREVPPDSGVMVAGEGIRRVLVGLDVGPAELKIAADLGFDAVIAHHPVQRRGFWRVFERHRELMGTAGIPEQAIRTAIDERAASIRLGEYNANDDHVVSIARLLGLPFLNVHLPLDEYGRRILIETVEGCQRRNPAATVGDIAAAIGELPSFRRGQLEPDVVYGQAEAPAGRVAVSVAAGTNGGYPVAAAYFAHGFDTVIYMHIQPEELARLRQSRPRGTLIVTGHVPGDGIGLDAFVQALRQRGLEVTTFSGVDTPLEA